MNISEDDLRRMGYEIRDGVAIRAEKGVMPLGAHQGLPQGPSREVRDGYVYQHGHPVIAPHEPLKRSKYRNKPTYVGDARFDSIHEAECWLAFQTMERAGTIWDLERQVPYELHCGTESGLRICVCVYIADFRWRDANALHVGDAKSDITKMNQMYQLKKRWMVLEHNIAIEEL